MAFRVEITPQAVDDIDSIADYIRKHSSFAVAEKWFNGIIDDIASLKEMPARCPVAPESEDVGEEIRLSPPRPEEPSVQDLLRHQP